MPDDQPTTAERKREFYLAKAQEAEDATLHAADDNERALLNQIAQSWRLLAIRLD